MRSFTRRLLAMVAATMLAVTGLTFVGASKAEAAVTGCNYYVGSDGSGYAYCSGGTGEFRVSIGCKGWINLGYGFTQYGNWERAGYGVGSVAKCPIGSWTWGQYATLYTRA